MKTSRKSLLSGAALAGAGLVAASVSPASATPMAGATLMALYKKPSDTDKFMAYYHGHHGPLADMLPGLTSFTISGPIEDPKAAYWMVAILEFPSMDALKSALGSDVGKKVVADLPNFASAGVDILTFPNANY